MSTLKTALAAMRDGDHAAARDALVVVWRGRRSPEIAEMIAVLDAAAPDATSAAIAAIVTPRAAASLANLEKLAKLDDPRLARWAIDALVKFPFTASTARPFLVAIAKTAARHDDPRLAARWAEISTALVTRMGRLVIRTQLHGLVDAAIKRMPPVTKATAADAKLEAAIAALVEPLRRAARSADALLAEIYANPADDAPRLVYADALTAQNDPRGEFIVLQIGRGDGAAGEREQTLLAKHGKVWLGDLAPVLSWGKGYAKTTFRRGFVCKADIILSVGKKLRPILAHPAWATVEEIDGLYDDDDKLLVHAPLRALRVLEVENEWLPALARRPEKLPVREIQIKHWEPADGALLRAAFPHVETVVVPLAEVTAEHVTTYTALGIDRVVLRDGVREKSPALAALAAALVGTPAAVARLSFTRVWETSGPVFELVRDRSGMYARA